MQIKIALDADQENDVVVHSLKDYYDVVDCDIAKMAINILLQHYLTEDEFNKWRKEEE